MIYMKINWKVRLKNPVFWLTVIPAVITFVYTVLGAVGVVHIITALISALTTVGVLVDPTTKGVGDSERAMGYDVPNDDSAG